jgi:ArsR family transcriptional regulator
MSKKVDAELIRSRERIFKALSDGTRLEIIEFLKQGERCVCEIIPSIGKSQSTTSKNLDILFRAGILDKHEDGKRSIYSIKHDEIFDLLKDADQINLKDFSAISKTVKALEMQLKNSSVKKNYHQ